MGIKFRSFKIGTNKRSRIYDQQGLSKTKTASEERRKKRFLSFLKIGIVLVATIFLLSLIIQIPQTLGKINHPFKNIPSKFANQESINLNFRTNILLLSIADKKVISTAIASYSNGDQKVNVVVIDPNTLFDSSSGTKFGQLVKFNNTGTFPSSIDKLKASLIETLFYPIDGYVIVESGANWTQKTTLEALANNLYSLNFFLNLNSNKDFLDKNLRTNLTVSQAFGIVNKVKGVKPERFNFIDISTLTTDSGTLDSNQVNNKLGLLLSDKKITAESATVEIVNASGIDGLGSVVKNLITNLGANVLSVSGADTTEKTTELLAKNKNGALTQRLNKIFNCYPKDLKNNQNNIDIKLIIGEDFGTFFDF